MGIGPVRQHPKPPTTPTRLLPSVQVEQRHQLRIVAGLTRGQDHRDRAAPLVGQRVNLGGQTTSGATQCVISRFNRQIRVVRRCPLCPPRSSRRPPGRWSCGRRRHAGAPAPRWSQPTTAGQRRQSRGRQGTRPTSQPSGPGHRSHRLTSGNAEPTRSANGPVPAADPATANRCGNASKSPPTPPGERSTVGHAALRWPATTAQPQPRTHPRSHPHAPCEDHQPREPPKLVDTL